MLNTYILILVMNGNYPSVIANFDERRACRFSGRELRKELRKKGLGDQQTICLRGNKYGILRKGNGSLRKSPERWEIPGG